jgi:hypothetical protein
MDGCKNPAWNYICGFERIKIMVSGLAKRRMRKEAISMSPAERMKRFSSIMEDSFKMMSEQGYYNFLKRNHHKRRMIFKNGKWQPLNKNLRTLK